MQFPPRSHPPWPSRARAKGARSRHEQHLLFGGTGQPPSGGGATVTRTLLREQIDESASDPREELAFQARLVAFSERLRSESGGVARAWKPGAPPDAWVRDSL
jgi:hypothetical protein